MNDQQQIKYMDITDRISRLKARALYALIHRLSCSIVFPKAKSSVTDQHAFIESFNNASYWYMLLDPLRMAAYEAAASDPRIQGRRFIDIGTGPRMPLSLMVLQGGATHVDAVEGNQQAFRRAEEFIKTLDVSARDRVRLHKGFSTDIRLSQRAGALIHDIIGTIASTEGLAHCLADAQERLLTDDALIIPSRIGTILVPAEMPRLTMRSKVVSKILMGNSQFDRSPGIQMTANPPRQSYLSSNPVIVEEFLCSSGAPHIRKQMLQNTHREIVITRDGGFSGFLLSLFVVTVDGAPVINGLEQMTSWGQVFAQIVEEPIQVKKGETIKVEFNVDARDFTPSYRLAVTFPPSDRSQAIEWKGPPGLLPS